jgi:hypothetical protein
VSSKTALCALNSLSARMGKSGRGSIWKQSISQVPCAVVRDMILAPVFARVEARGLQIQCHAFCALKLHC